MGPHCGLCKPRSSAAGRTRPWHWMRGRKKVRWAAAPRDLPCAACIEGLDRRGSTSRALSPGSLRAADARSQRRRASMAELCTASFGLADASGTASRCLRYFHGRSSLATWLRTVLANARRSPSGHSVAKCPPRGSVAAPIPRGDAGERTGSWHDVAVRGTCRGHAAARSAPVVLLLSKNLTLSRLGRARRARGHGLSGPFPARQHRVDVERQLSKTGWTRHHRQCFET